MTFYSKKRYTRWLIVAASTLALVFITQDGKFFTYSFSSYCVASGSFANAYSSIIMFALIWIPFLALMLANNGMSILEIGARHSRMSVVIGRLQILAKISLHLCLIGTLIQLIPTMVFLREPLYTASMAISPFFLRFQLLLIVGAVQLTVVSRTHKAIAGVFSAILLGGGIVYLSTGILGKSLNQARFLFPLFNVGLSIQLGLVLLACLFVVIAIFIMVVEREDFL
ncbi:hypothetical protein [Lacticaseibacillus yichunensis]|uniref:ABC transporter permease n=1 Tax=Lacticaseibacillus yichunensis TaxID=2486015 RepID=A0ABW4CMK0_9LACO|nr:hypothetical protein [Lacticaseibacillus yichunensis]